MAHHSAHSKDPRPVVAVDWSFHGVHTTTNGVDVTFFASLEELLDTLTTPHQICAESTFESWDPQRRQALVDLLRARGHEIYVYRPIHTARSRGDTLTKTDANDARVIYHLATGGRIHLYPLPSPDPTWAEFRESCNHEYQHLRLTQKKAALATAAKDILGTYKELDPESRSVLGNDKTYSDTLLAATYFAATKAPTRAIFERLLGLHGSAYPSLLRSEVHHHCYRHARSRGVSWTTYRRVLRRTYAAYRSAGITPALPIANDPSGTCTPVTRANTPSEGSLVSSPSVPATHP